MKLRPHHIYCYHFNSFADSSKGINFNRVQDSIAALWNGNPDNTTKTITVQEGADILCAVCPCFDGTGCTHPNGGNKGVIKWDSKITAEIDIHHGQTFTIDEINNMVNRKAPLQFCINRCPYHKSGICNAGVKS
jgi:hypothetical protein